MLLRQCHRDAVVPGPSPPIAFNAAYESLAEAVDLDLGSVAARAAFSLITHSI
jgi:hypothetical protein